MCASLSLQFVNSAETLVTFDASSAETVKTSGTHAATAADSSGAGARANVHPAKRVATATKTIGSLLTYARPWPRPFKLRTSPHEARFRRAAPRLHGRQRQIHARTVACPRPDHE